MRGAAAFLLPTLLFVSACAAPVARYFPQSEFRDLQDYESDLPRRFSAYLAAAEEAVLFNDVTADFAVRLTIIPSFKPGEVITLRRENGAVSIRKMILSAAVRPENARVLSQTSIAPNSQAVDHLKAAIQRSGFWAATNKQELIGSDGNAWVLEVKSAGQYHAIYQWEPHSGAVFDVGTALKQLVDAD